MISTWHRNAREVLEVSLANIEGCGHVVKLPKLYQSLNGDPPREMEQGLILSPAVRHLAALVAAFTQVDARARQKDLLGPSKLSPTGASAPRSDKDRARSSGEPIEQDRHSAVRPGDRPSVRR